MPIETVPFDAADFLDTPEAVEEFLVASFESAAELGDPRLITNALGVVARAKGMTQSGNRLPAGMDEIDALGISRDDMQHGDTTSRRLLAEFLLQSESLQAADDVVLVAATNCASSLRGDNTILPRPVREKRVAVHRTFPSTESASSGASASSVLSVASAMQVRLLV